MTTTVGSTSDFYDRSLLVSSLLPPPQAAVSHHASLTSLCHLPAAIAPVDHSHCTIHSSPDTSHLI